MRRAGCCFSPPLHNLEDRGEKRREEASTFPNWNMTAERLDELDS